MEDIKPFFLILGMHRSGTSCLTGALARCGVSLGKVRKAGNYNKKGYFELADIQKTQDQILVLNKSNWSQPRKDPIQVHSHHATALQQTVNELKETMPCGLKDPRCLLLLEFWKRIVGDDIQLMGTFRHPMAVAQSLFHRNNIPIEEGLKLWLHYNEILINEHKLNNFPLIYFDLSSQKTYINRIISLAKEYHLKPNKWLLYLFVSSKLEHYQYASEAVPSTCFEAYQYLIEHSYENQQ